MTDDNLATVRVYRFEPGVDLEPRYDAFENIPYRGATVLDVLNYIHEHIDSSLVYRRSCRSGVCDICVVRVNGKSALACKKQAEKDMTIEPPRAGTPVRDLVVEMTVGRKPGKGHEDTSKD